MRVRIVLKRSPRHGGVPVTNALPVRSGTSAAVRARQTALIVASLLTPLALMAWTLGMWRIAADMKWTGAFAITHGLFSHWQVWFALAIAVQFGGFLLHRYAGSGDEDRDGGAAFS